MKFKKGDVVRFLGCTYDVGVWSMLTIGNKYLIKEMSYSHPNQVVYAQIMCDDGEVVRFPLFLWRFELVE